MPATNIAGDDAGERREQARRECAERNRLEDPWALDVPVGPDEAFSDTYVEADDVAPENRGPNSPAVGALFRAKCCGWPRMPTAAECYAAMRAEAPTRRQMAILSTVVGEGDAFDIVNAWHEGAFTWRQLARAMRATGPWTADKVRLLNRFATVGEHDGEPVWNA